MPNYKVAITRVSYSGHDIEVEAKDEAEAQRKAMEEAGDLVFSECSAEYQIDYVKEIP